MPHPSGFGASPDTKPAFAGHENARKANCPFLASRVRVVSCRGGAAFSCPVAFAAGRRLKRRGEARRRSFDLSGLLQTIVLPLTFKPCVGAAFHAAEPRRKATGFRGRASAQAPTSVARHKPPLIRACGRRRFRRRSCSSIFKDQRPCGLGASLGLAASHTPLTYSAQKRGLVQSLRKAQVLSRRI